MFLVLSAIQAAPAPSSGISSTGFIIQMAAIAAIFYFLMIRPQQKAKKQHEERLRNLRKGDAVITAGGLVGEVVHIKESPTSEGPQKSMDDHITIRTGDTRVVVVRRRIEAVGGAGSGEKSAAS